MSTNFPTSLDSYTAHADGVSEVIAAAHINALQDAVAALEAKVGANSSAVTTSLDYKVTNAIPSPAAVSGLLAWSFDPAGSSQTATATTTSPNVYTMAVYLPACTVTNLHMYVVAGAVTTHLAMALYNTTGTLLSQTADKTSDGNVTGLKTYALGAPQTVAAGYYYIAMACTGSSPSFYSASTSTAAILNAGGAAPPVVARVCTSATAYTTTMPSPLGTLSGAAGRMFWVAAS